MIAAGISYRERGAGQPVVMLHGIGSDAAAFADLMAALPDARCIAWSMPGYDASPALSSDPPTFAALSVALSRFLEALAMPRVHLVGHSIGGMLALEHAMRVPEQVETLTLIGTTAAFGGRDDSFKEAFLTARLAPLDVGLTMAEMGVEAAPHLCGPNTSAATLAAVAEGIGRVPEATWRAILQCLVTFNRRDDLSAIPHRTCLIAGTHDSNAPAKTMARMADTLPNAALHTLKEIGHMIPQEAPGRVAEIMRKFLS
ncbi:MAG: alpha/beta hydrolase [Pseudomonadota bacterium]